MNIGNDNWYMFTVGIGNDSCFINTNMLCIKITCIHIIYIYVYVNIYIYTLLINEFVSFIYRYIIAYH